MLPAAVIVGQTAGVHRFCIKDAFTRFTGTAPCGLAWINKSRVRLHRRINRGCELRVFYMIAVAQACGVGPWTDIHQQEARPRQGSSCRPTVAASPPA